MKPGIEKVYVWISFEWRSHHIYPKSKRKEDPTIKAMDHKSDNNKRPRINAGSMFQLYTLITKEIKCALSYEQRR